MDSVREYFVRKRFILNEVFISCFFDAKFFVRFRALS